MRQIILIVSLFILHAINLLAGDTLALKPGFQQIDLLKWGQLYRTPEASADVETLSLLPKSAFVKLSETDGSFFTQSDFLWVKVPLLNSGAEPLQLLVQCTEVRTNRLQFFVMLAIGPPRVSPEMGDYLPFSRRMIPHPTYLYPLALGASESVTLYIRYDKREETLTLQPKLWEEAAFDRQDQGAGFLIILFLGALTCLAGVVTVLGVIARQPLLLSFAVYAISGLLMVYIVTGYGAMYLWPDHPYLNGLGYLFVIIFHLSLLQMAKLYLRLRTVAAGLHRLFHLEQALLLFVFLPGVLSYPILSGGFKIWLGRLGLLLLLVVNLGIIVASWLAYRRQSRVGALFFLLAFMFSLAALVLFELEQLGSVNTIWNTELTLLFMLLDLLTMGALFGHYLRRTFIEHAQLSEALSRSRLKAANALLMGQFEERKRLSQELHDGISIKLALLKMRLSGQNPEAGFDVKPILNDLTQLSEDIRNFTHAVSPALLEEEGLAVALHDLTDRAVLEAGLQVKTDLSDFDEERVTQLQRYSVFLVVQELLNNTLKHAQAQSVRIKLSTQEASELLYCDDGIGMPEAKWSSGLGLRNIDDRAKLLGGQFEFYSPDSGGSFFRFVF